MALQLIEINLSEELTRKKKKPAAQQMQIPPWFGIVVVVVVIGFAGFYLFVKGHNLVKAMVTGKKPHSHVPAEARIAFTRPVIALVLLLLVLTAGGVAWFLIQGGVLL